LDTWVQIFNDLAPRYAIQFGNSEDI
jgi:hypothetical protein